MGLSGEERRNGIFWAIRHIVEKARDLPAHEEAYAKIRQLAEKLWPAYLNGQSNGLHWFAGSSASNDVEGQNCTAWDTAVAEHIERVCNEPADERLIFTGFDPFEGYLDIAGLLVDPHQTVYKLFAWTEQMTYYLRRYDDELQRQCSKLSSLCSRIQGECFSRFVNAEEFAYAYVAEGACRILYYDLWPESKRGHTATWLMKENIHHDIGSTVKNKEVPLKRLLEIHTELRRIRPENRCTHRNEIRRLLFAVELAGSALHYKHQQDALRKHLKDACAWTTKEISQVSAALDKFCQEKRKESRADKYIDALFYAKYDSMQYEEERKQRSGHAPRTS